MNNELIKLIEELDCSEVKMNEYSISSKIDAVTKNDQSLEASAEKIAFDFCENYTSKTSGWGTYFEPMTVWIGDNDITHTYPCITSITKEILSHWRLRAEKTKNPILKSRYYGLIWDLSKVAIDEKPDYEIAIEYVNALNELLEKDLYEHATEAITKIKRAYQVASCINNTVLIKRCINNAINLENRIAEDENPGLWGFCFELFILKKCKYLTDIQEKKLLEDLENRLDRVSKIKSPWLCESAGVPLAEYYRSKGKKEDVVRIIRLVGNSFENSCDGLAAIQVSSWLQHMHGIYNSFNMKTDAERVAKKISGIGPDVMNSMKKFSHEMNIPIEELEAYLGSMTEGGLEVALQRIAGHFIPKRDQLKQQVLELAKNHPLQYTIRKTLHGYKGRPVATIGALKDDLEGNLIYQVSQNMKIDSFFLGQSLNKAIELYNVTAGDLINFIYLSPLFEESKKELIYAGVQAYLNKEYFSAIHILVPQTEAAIRTLVEITGGSILKLKKNKQEGLQLRTFDELLRDEKVVSCFGTDSSFYFRILLTDQRGWNVRNDICHGIVPSEAFNYLILDRIMHVILCLSMARKEENVP